ncbi:VIT1/CCC1 transporter family protein [Methylococcus sp. EFPC2]|uniref:VIT1/CCC1 transporter family protein n=1 Tax=Methylococcus sp. EFPC2 TaxID=2812648 RepID=UPI001967B86B|nr:VIT1/CCC1 transporter family protein [Methylococcus sp. EFPC2]QSA98570.1 VIT1/CCC1 transporter family protein [Methylococcus sp. EFPC2]
MPQTSHIERHFTGSESVRDIVIGMADGLTVPFALAAGLTGAIDTTGLIVTAGLAEIAAGSIAMGLGGYLAAKSDAEHYQAERKREEFEVEHKPGDEVAEVVEIFTAYGVKAADIKPVITALRRRPEVWVDFMMRFELGLEKPDPRRALISALTIATSYILGGLIPLGPYIVLPTAQGALEVSVVITLLALAVFGYVKGRYTGTRPWRSAFQTLFTGGLAAGAAYAIARAIS